MLPFGAEVGSEDARDVYVYVYVYLERAVRVWHLGVFHGLRLGLERPQAESNTGNLQ